MFVIDLARRGKETKMKNVCYGEIQDFLCSFVCMCGLIWVEDVRFVRNCSINISRAHGFGFRRFP